MAPIQDTLALAAAAARAHKLRVALTVLGIMMGVATLITVVTLIQGANLYVEQKIANLGTNVFQVSRTPFAVTDFNEIIKALRNKRILREDYAAVAATCVNCRWVGARASNAAVTRYRDQALEDTNVLGHTPSMAYIDTRTVVAGRYFTETEEARAAAVCLIGDALVRQLFVGLDPLGRQLRVGAQEFTVIGVYEKIGSVLGQDQDNFVVIPLRTFQKMFGTRRSLTLEIQAHGSGAQFEAAQDEVRLILRARRQRGPNQEDDFFIGTAQSYIALWQSISSAFFAVFIMVSSIAAVVGGIVIMNVMLVSVTERTKEIGIHRAVGATQRDILRQFLAESLMQCVAGGVLGIAAGFLAAYTVRRLTEFPVAVETWVAVLGVALSSLIGLFFGIYPATRAAKLDPVEALRAE